MAKLARQAKTDYRIRATALDLVALLPEKDSRGEIVALHKFVRDRIRYVKDINGIETLATPAKTLEIGQGDCDDKSTLLAALLETIGYRARFTAVGTSKNNFSHVLPEVFINGEWLPLEVTEQVSPGWFPDRARFPITYSVDV